ncbi:hypothetical protein BC827DRAFT_1244233 [Russula dissimulans]|nr:hypothetical protein BC827DRAFT_1244233 [Russula dissimulans]
MQRQAMLTAPCGCSVFDTGQVGTCYDQLHSVSKCTSSHLCWKVRHYREGVSPRYEHIP